MAVEKSGVHLTGADSGWPTGDPAKETPYTKDGTGTDVVGHKAQVAAGGVITDATSANEIQTITVTGTSGTWKPHASAPAQAYGATGAAVQTVLEAIYGVGNVVVARSGAGPYVYQVTFHGTLTDTDIAALTASDVDLVGTGHGAVVATPTPGSP
jgi:hypothetical protein